MKFYQLIWSAVIILFFSSCHKNWFNQEPLSEVPDHLKKGVLETGPGQFSNFEDFIVGKMLRMTVNDETENILKFKEGERSVYKIKLEFLNEFDFKYEILDFKNPFSSLTGSKWTYNSETKTGQLIWTPDKSFNQGFLYRKLDFQIQIKLRKTAYPRKNSSLTVLKDLELFVYKNTYQPEIIGLQTRYSSYIKLEDDLFYEDTRINSFNLNYYNNFFIPNFVTLSHAGPSRDSGNKKIDLVFENTSSNSSAPSGLFEIDPRNILNKGIFEITDEKGDLVPYSILSYLKRPYYQLVERLERSDCVGFKDKNFCWIPLKEVENLPLKKQVYVKNYIIPKSLDLNKLYYRVNSALECEVYSKVGYSQQVTDLIFRKSYNESEGQFCYLALTKLDVFNSDFVSESHSIYFLEKDTFRKINIKKWEQSFEELPLYLKFQMSGRKPVEKINISYMNAKNFNKIFFKVKDENYFNSQPNLYFENIIKERVYSLFPIHFIFESVAKVDTSIFEIEFSFDVEKHEEYKNYQFKIAPNSGPITGQSISIEASVFPSVLREIEYHFNPESDLKKEVWKKGEEWAEAVINLKTQIRNRYTFPKSFYENLNFVDLDINSFKRNIIFEETTAMGGICNSSRDSDFLKSRNCYCSEENFYKDEEENIYMESICHYSAQFHLLPSHLEDNFSGYIQYGYNIKDQSLHFPDFSLISNKDEKRVVSINEKNYLISESDSLNGNKPEEFVKSEVKKEEVDFKTLIHFFFNLKASWKCEESSESNKKSCRIQYPLNDNRFISIGFYNKFLSRFLGDHILADTKCFRRDDRESFTSDLSFNKEYPCDCKAIEFFRDRLELSCDFDSDTLIEFRLKTDHPHVYFFNKEEEGNKQTPLERLDHPHVYFFNKKEEGNKQTPLERFSTN